jgi:hypothetical protein
MTRSSVATFLALILSVVACTQASGQNRPRTGPEPAKPFRSQIFAQHKQEQADSHQLLQGNRAVLGKVEAVTSEQIKVNIGEVQPRFLPLSQAKEKNFPPIKTGDDLIIVLSGQNLIVDYHPLDYPSSSHTILRGEIAQNLPIGQDRVVIKEAGGKEESFEIRSQARSKIAAIPVGLASVFLLDETGKVIDATFVDINASKQADKQPDLKSPIKGAHRQIDGTVVEPLTADRITIRTGEGSERPFEVRGVIHEKLSNLRKGESVILLVDKDNKVIDVAIPPRGR